MFLKILVSPLVTILLISVSILFFTSNLQAQKPRAASSLDMELKEDEKKQIQNITKGKINKRTGHPVSLYGVNQQMTADTPERMAEEYLNKNAALLGLKYSDLKDLSHHFTRTTNAGSVVRFRQLSHGLPVNKNEITINIDPQNRVQYVQSSYEPLLDVKDVRPQLSPAEASQLVSNYIQPQSILAPMSNQLMIYQNEKEARLAYEVVIHCSTPLGEWHAFVDAKTGDIFKVEDQLRYYCKSHKGDKTHTHEGCSHGPGDPIKKKAILELPTPMMVNGNGFVFDPDPLSSNTVNYGGNYSDNSDATNTDLDAARFNYTLLDITQSGSTYKLEGPWAEIVEHEAPSTGLFTQNSPVFEFNRQEQGFEAVSVYYHVDYMMRYVNLTLGCNITPTQYTGGVQFDPHGANGGDQSYYTGAAGRIVFGEGGVDDGEDSDVIHHELGHALHDWVTGGNLSQVDGLSEGSGDYIAQSYNRGLGYWAPTDPQYHWVFNWDGHNPFWPGRVTNDTDIYPTDLGSGIHNDGQMWASTMMQIWDDIGQQQADKIFYEGLGMTNGSSSQDDAANAVYQAAINLGYTSTELTFIHTHFTNRGYNLPVLNGPPLADFTADKTSLCLDDGNTISFTDLSSSSPPATNWSWSFQGGSPATSSVQNPTVSYSTPGVYDVTLTVTNVNGVDTKTRAGYITITQGAGCPVCESSVNTTPVAINDGPPATYTSTMNINTTGTINDVNIPNIVGTHTWVSDLSFSIEHPDGTIVNLIGNDCGDTDDFNIGFDDQSSNTNPPCPYVDGQVYVPVSPLSAFNGKPANGTWTLRIVDGADQDGGQLTSWELEVCANPPADPDCVQNHDLPGTIASDTYKASDWIVSNGKVAANANVFFEAGNFIELEPEFEVFIDGTSTGTVFSAIIEDCIPAIMSDGDEK